MAEKLADILRIYLSSNLISSFKNNDELKYLVESTKNFEKASSYENRSEDEINDIILNCTKCGNSLEKKLGYGSGAKGVMIVLNAPGLISSNTKKKYKNESLALLKRIIASINLDYRECYITNLIKCDSTDSHLIPSKVVESCRDILSEELNNLRPKIVLVMGDIKPLQSFIRKYKDVFWYNIDHPITLIKNSELKKPAWNTLKLIIDKIENIF